MRWSAPADNGGADIVRYEVRHAAGASVPGDTAWTPVGLAETHTVSGLTNGTAYAFEVRAVSHAAAGAAATAAATPATVPSLPRNVVVTAEDGGVVFRWSAPADDGGSSSPALRDAQRRRRLGTRDYALGFRRGPELPARSGS